MVGRRAKCSLSRRSVAFRGATRPVPVRTKTDELILSAEFTKLVTFGKLNGSKRIVGQKPLPLDWICQKQPLTCLGKPSFVATNGDRR